MSAVDPGRQILDAVLSGRTYDPPNYADVIMDEATGTGTEGIYWRLWIKGHEANDFVTASVKNAIEGTVRKSRRTYVPSTWTIPRRNLLVRTIQDYLKGGLGRAEEGPQEWPVTRVDCRWQPTSEDEWFEAKEWMEKTVNRSIRSIQEFNPQDLPRALATWFGMDGTVIGLQPELRTGHDTNYNDTMPQLTDIGWHKWRVPGQAETIPFSFVSGLPFGGLGPPVNSNASQWSTTDPQELVLNWSFHLKENVATVGEHKELEVYIRESFGKWMATFWNAPWIRQTQYNDLPDPHQWCQFLDIKIQPASIGVYEDADSDLRAGDISDDDDDDSHEFTFRVSCKWNVDRTMMGIPFFRNAFRPVLGPHVTTQSGIHEYELLCIKMHRIESVRARATDIPQFVSGWRQHWTRQLWPRLSREQYNQWKCGLIGVPMTQLTINQAVTRHDTDEERRRVRTEFEHTYNKERQILHWRFWIKGAIEDAGEFGLHMRRVIKARVLTITGDERVRSNAGFLFSYKTKVHFGDPRAKTRGMTRVDCWWMQNRNRAIPLLTAGLLGNGSTRVLSRRIEDISRLFEIDTVVMAEGDQPTWRAIPDESVNTVPPHYDNQHLYDTWQCDLSKVHG